MSIQKEFEMSSARSFVVDIPICNNAEHGGVYIIDRMYDMCKALNITLIGHDPQDGLTTSFHFQHSADSYAFDLILRGGGTQENPEYLYPMNASIPLDYFEKAIIQYCQDHDIRITDIERCDDENCVEIMTDRDIGMSSIMHADKRGVFDMMAMHMMELNSVEHIFTIDLPRHIVDIKKFQQNFQDICKHHDITAHFEMDTPYIRRLRITTNSTEGMVMLKKLHTQGAFNVGLHHKAIQILPEFSK